MKVQFERKKRIKKQKYFAKEQVAKGNHLFKGLLCQVIYKRTKHGNLPISKEMFDPAIVEVYLKQLNNK